MTPPLRAIEFWCSAPSLHSGVAVATSRKRPYILRQAAAPLSRRGRDGYPRARVLCLEGDTVSVVHDTHGHVLFIVLSIYICGIYDKKSLLQVVKKWFKGCHYVHVL